MTTIDADGRLKFGIFLAPFHPVGQNPTLGPRARPAADRAPRRARLRRGLVRRAPLGRLRDHRLARGLHRRRRPAHQAHPPRHRRLVAALPPPVHAGRPHGAARPPDPRPRHDRRGPGRAALRRLHDGHRPGEAARHDGGVARGDPAAAGRRDGHHGDGLVHARQGPPAAAALPAPLPRGGGGGAGVARPGPGRRGASAAVCCPSGPRRRAASTCWASHWDVMEERAASSRTTVDRNKWRLVGPMHIADTKEQAVADVAFGLGRLGRLLRAGGRPAPRARTPRTSSRWSTRSTRRASPSSARSTTPSRRSSACRPSPAASAPSSLMGHEWADTAATRHSYELFARYVAPRFQGSSASLTSSRDWAAENRPEFIGAAGNAVMSAIQKHHEEKADKAEQPDEETPCLRSPTSRCPTNGIELHVAVAGPRRRRTGGAVPRLPRAVVLVAPPARRAGRRGLPGLAPDLRGYGGSSHPTEVADYGSDKLTGDLCGLLDHYGYDERHLRRARLGRHGGLGAGAPAPRARLVPLQHERPLLQRAGAPDADLRGDLRRQVLLHALLPAGRAGGGRVRGGPAPLPAHHALLGRRRGHGRREPARLGRAAGGHPLPGHPHAGARRAAGLDHRGTTSTSTPTRSSRAASSAPSASTATSTPTGSAPRTSRPPSTPCPPASSPARSTPCGS